MKILFFCPRWGSEHLPIEDFFSRAKKDGYDGVEMLIPTEEKQASDISRLLKQYELSLIAQQGESYIETSFVENMLSFEKHIRNAAAINPLFISSQTGKDYFSFEENCKLLERSFVLEKELDIAITHETHRGKSLYSTAASQPYLNKYEDMKLTADLSHWVIVGETHFHDPIQSAILRQALEKSTHIHARIGHEQGSQVGDPRAPEWEQYLELYFKWWEQIVLNLKKRKANYATITPEFGPPMYMPLLPFTKAPVGNQWEINVFMMNYLRDRLLNI